MKTIIEHRISLGMTIPDLCRVMNISRNQYYRIAMGLAQLSEVERRGLDNMPRKRGPKKK